METERHRETETRFDCPLSLAYRALRQGGNNIPKLSEISVLNNDLCRRCDANCMWELLKFPLTALGLRGGVGGGGGGGGGGREEWDLFRLTAAHLRAERTQLATVALTRNTYDLP